MTCTQCGHENPPQARHCTACGASVEGDAGNRPGGRDSRSESQAAPDSDSKQRAVAGNDEGVRLLDSGDYEGAIAAFTAAIVLDPRFHAAYRNRAQTLRKLGRSREAEDDLGKVESQQAARERHEFQRGRGNFRVAFAWTAIPIVALGVISTAGAASEGFFFLWFAGAGLVLLAPLVAIGFAIGRKSRVAAGILAGFGVGILALALTFLANFSYYGGF
jgi:tetratricopeptide (TPR) repeat protein